MECEFCKNIFISKTNLNQHQKRAKYCLKLRGKNKEEPDYKCYACNKYYSGKYELNRHKKNCKANDNIEEIKDLRGRLSTAENIIKELRNQIEKYREDFNNLSITAVKRPVSNTKNIQINNYIQNMKPLTVTDIDESVPMLTLEHHAKGAEGYAEFALEFPFKDKIVCVDVNRNKIKYKNDEGDIIEDNGFRKMMTKLCIALKDRSFNLCQEHYEKLSDTFTDKEMDEYNFMETAIAIAKYSNGRENDFCNKIIKLISNKSKVK